jgi:hypothetical protein
VHLDKYLIFSVRLNKNPVTRGGFKEWLSGYRNLYDYLELSFHNQVVVPSDPEKDEEELSVSRSNGRQWERVMALFTSHSSWLFSR